MSRHRNNRHGNQRLLAWGLGILCVVSFIESLSPYALSILIFLAAAGAGIYFIYINQQRVARQTSLVQLPDSFVAALGGTPFEDYVEAIFKRLGYHTETTSITNDDGVDLIITKDGVRSAVQCKGYQGSVGKEAVQQAYTGMAHYRCDRAIAVTNSSFTRGAINLAQSVGCQLIDGKELAYLAGRATRMEAPDSWSMIRNFLFR